MNLAFWKKSENKKESGSTVKAAIWGSDGYSGGTYVKSYDGQKNLGEIGPVVDYRLNFKALSLRSWQAYLESDIAKTVLDTYIKWIVDVGLKCKANPSKEILSSEIGGFDNTDAEAFNRRIEARWHVWAKSTKSTHGDRMSFNKLSQEIFKGAIIGGDQLVILRYVNRALKVQVVDGIHLSSPYSFAETEKIKIVHGIEIDKKTNKHIAYHVKISPTRWDRIPAYNKQGFQTAFLVLGSKYRADDERGIPIISASLESISKMDRYKEATVGSAEERQKVVWQVVHQAYSDGENPISDKIAFAFDADNEQNDELPQTIAGKQLASEVYATTNKQTFNNPIGAKLESLSSDNELSFKEFWDANADIVCGGIGIPPNVAWSIYNDSFSASRAATKDWEHTIHVRRDDFTTQFLQKVYNFFLFTQVLENKVDAPGYIEAIESGDFMIQEAYQCVRFTGPLFPHIDPLKEVQAERLKLGRIADAVPLTTVEQATENLNSGDFESNVDQFAEEIETAKGNGLDLSDPKAVVSQGESEGEND